MKSFWSHVNSLKSSHTPATKLSFDGRDAESAVGKCELFSDYFSSVFTKDRIPTPVFDFGWNFSITQCVVTASDVQHKLASLDPNKGAGPDAIPPSVLRYCAPVLAPHLAVWFTSLLSLGIFPSTLKRGYVVPIFKSGDRSKVMNYRPIVILSAVAKVYESIVLDYLYFHLRKCISSSQHGFLRSRSTVTNLMEFQEYVMAAFGDAHQIDCVYLDLTKAFDKVNHTLLVAKLAGFGVGGSLLKWLDSYLTDRTLAVKYDGCLSVPFSVLSGVPQGSHLGPLLFNLFMNDIGKVILTRYLMFADDIKVFGPVSLASDFERLQASLTNIDAWCKENFMELNVLKCVIISYKRGAAPAQHDYVLNGATLKRVEKVRDLGVIMTPSLSPQEHIAHITAKASSLLGFIFRSTRNFNSPSTMITLYKSLVRPLLEYGSVVWSPFQKNHVHQVEFIQARFIRMLGPRLGFTYRTTPVEDVEKSYALLPLSLRRHHADVFLLFKLVNGLIDCPNLLSSIDISTPRGTRSKTIFNRRFHPTYYAYNNGICRLLKAGSSAAVQLDFFCEKPTSFKKKVSCLLT